MRECYKPVFATPFRFAGEPLFNSSYLEGLDLGLQHNGDDLARTVWWEPI